MNPPRHHNSQRAPRGRIEWNRPGPSSGKSFETPLWIPIVAGILFVLLSPLWVPVYLVRLPFLLRNEHRKKKAAQAEKALAASIPAEPPPPVDAELERRRDLARRTNQHDHPKLRFLYDPINDDPDFAWAIQEAGDRATEEVGHPFVMGTCHRIWNRKKQILKEEFGIDW